MLKEKIKQLKRVLGAPVPDDNVIDSAGTEENPVTLEIDGVDHEVSSIEEIYATEEEKEQMNDEVDEGYVLACQCHPRSERVVLNFDEY